MSSLSSIGHRSGLSLQGPSFVLRMSGIHRTILSKFSVALKLQDHHHFTYVALENVFWVFFQHLPVMCCIWWLITDPYCHEKSQRFQDQQK